MKKICLGIAVCLMLLSIIVPVNAKNQLDLDQVVVGENLEHVNPDETIYLHFTNNVVNLSVRDNNMSCFSVTDEDGQSVDIEVYMGDDQVDRDIKRIVEIRPINFWAKGTVHTLHISSAVQAKNETTLVEPIEVVFKVTGEKEADFPMVYLIGGLTLLAFSLGGILFVRKKR